MQREERLQKIARSQKLFGEIQYLEGKLATWRSLLITQANTQEKKDVLNQRIDAGNKLLLIKRPEWTEINRQLTNTLSSSLPATGGPRRNNSGNPGTTRRWRCDGGICGWFSGSGKQANNAANTLAGTRGGNRKKLSKVRKTRSKKTRSYRN